MKIEDIVEFEKTRIQQIDGMDKRVIRGISDSEATFLFQNFPEYISQFPRVKEGVGFGYLHAEKHGLTEFSQVEDFKEAINEALLSPLYELRSSGDKLYLKDMDDDGLNYMLALTFQDPVLQNEVLRTSYTAVAKTGPKDLSKTFERMAKSKDLFVFAAPDSEASDRTIEVYTNDDVAVMVKYNLVDSKFFIRADYMTRSDWESTKSGLIIPSVKSVNRYFKRIQEDDRVVDLTKLKIAA